MDKTRNKTKMSGNKRVVKIIADSEEDEDVEEVEEDEEVDEDEEVEEDEEGEEEEDDDDDADMEVNSKKKIFKTPRDWINEIYKKSSSNKANDRYDCPFCNIKKLKLHGIQSHLAASHYQEFFVQKLCKTLSETVIRNNCADVLEAEVEKAKPVITGNEKRKKVPKFVCEFCYRKSFLDHFGFRRHFVMHHFNVLEENLLDLLTNKKRNKQEELSTSKSSAPDSFIANTFLRLCEKVPLNKKKTSEKCYRCGYCRGETIQTKTMIEKHLTSAHPEVFFAKRKLKKVSEKDFVRSCNEYIDQKAFHENDDEVLQCSFCTFKHQEEADLHYHLILKHHEILCENISKYQKKFENKGDSAKQKKKKQKKTVNDLPDFTEPSRKSSRERKAVNYVESLLPPKDPEKKATKRREVIVIEEEPLEKRVKERVEYTGFGSDTDPDSDFSCEDSELEVANKYSESDSSAESTNEAGPSQSSRKRQASESESDESSDAEESRPRRIPRKVTRKSGKIAKKEKSPKKRMKKRVKYSSFFGGSDSEFVDDGSGIDDSNKKSDSDSSKKDPGSDSSSEDSEPPLVIDSDESG